MRQGTRKHSIRNLTRCCGGLAVCVVVLAAAEATAESPNHEYLSLLRAPSQQMTPEEESAPDGFTSPTVVSAADFRNDGGSVGSQSFLFSGGYMSGGTGGCFMAPVYVPGDATITQLSGTVYDDDAASNVAVVLFRVQNYYGVVTPLGGISSAGHPLGLLNLSDTSIVEPLVTYPHHSYYLATCLDNPDQRIYSFRIYWTK